VSDAEVAEVSYTAFASKKGQAITARLIVRRVRDQNHTASSGQGELFPAWRYHLLNGTEDAHGLACSRRSSCRGGASARRFDRRRHRADNRQETTVTCGSAGGWRRLHRLGACPR